MVKIGADIHFVLEEGRSKGSCRPGVVVKDWSPRPGPPGMVNLIVFLDGSNDGGADATEPSAA